MESKNHSNVKMLVEAAMMIAISYVLSLIKVFQMPMGGSITAGSMVPLVIFAYRWGGKKGVFVGAVAGVFQLVLGQVWSVHPLSFILDYLVAFGALGTVGFFAKKDDSLLKANIGIVVAMALRFTAHFLSGAIVFGMYAPEGTSPWVYSFGYNIGYMSIETLVTVLLFSLLYKPLKTIK